MSTKRSIIIDGAVTSISMENVFWEEVDKRSALQGMPWQEFVRCLLSGMQDLPNRSAALRELLLNQLRDECARNRSESAENWWLVTTSTGQREIGTRGSRLVVGRGAMCEIVIDDHDVSRKHLLLAFDGDAWWATDLVSKNGTWLKGQRVQAVKLLRGMSLSLGHAKLSSIN